MSQRKFPFGRSSQVVTAPTSIMTPFLFPLFGSLRLAFAFLSLVDPGVGIAYATLAFTFRIGLRWTS